MSGGPHALGGVGLVFGGTVAVLALYLSAAEPQKISAEKFPAANFSEKIQNKKLKIEMQTANCYEQKLKSNVQVQQVKCAAQQVKVIIRDAI